MVPLAKPGIATITMLSAMGFWNEYPLALVLLTEDAKKTLPIGMANLFEVQKYATDWGALFAGLVIVMIPTIIIYLIGQRYLLQGIGAGILCYSHPLVCVKLCRIKNLRIFRSISPFPIGICIHSKMKKRIKLCCLIGKLTAGGNNF